MSGEGETEPEPTQQEYDDSEENDTPQLEIPETT
jgi:hypothetical protein